MKVISLGAGVQSSALLLMALEGRFGDVPDCAIFADTQWEPKAVYAWLERLEREAAPFPIHRVSAGNFRADYLAGAVPSSKANATHYAALPTYVRNADGSRGMGRRQCSKEYKITPMRRFVRELVGPNGTAESWIGISLDEAHRMRTNDVKWLCNRYPLIDARLRREDCANYLVERLGASAPKSSCIGCPFHGDDYWRWLRDEWPEDFADAVEFDRRIRHQRDVKGEMFIHSSLIPLGDIKEFRHEKQGRMFLDGFGNECEGVCGL